MHPVNLTRKSRYLTLIVRYWFAHEMRFTGWTEAH